MVLKPDKNLELRRRAGWVFKGGNVKTGKLSNNAINSAHNSFITSGNGAPLQEKGDWRAGTREVFCPKCSTYIKHGSDQGSTPMDNHLRSARCREATNTISLRNNVTIYPQIPPSPVHVSYQPGECPGAFFKWEVGSLFATYPFTIHEPGSRSNPGYSLESVDFVSCIMRVRAPDCFRSTIMHGYCNACSNLDSSISKVEKWAQQSFGKKSTGRLNHVQMEAKITAVARHLKAEQLKKINYWKYLKRARKSVDDYKKLFDLISNSQVPGLSRLLSNANKEGWSPSKTSEKTALAIKGEYHARNYTEFDIDLAILIYELGGGAALYALKKAPIMLPSRHTIADVRRQHSLRITVGEVKVSDILENIEVLFNDIEPGEYDRVGHTLSQDEIAGDGRLCDLEDTDEIGGLCEHATSRLKTFKMGSDLTSIEDAVKAIRADEIHVGKEFSVAAFSRHAPTDYGAKPVLLMPTCKKGSWQSSAQILQKLIQAWKLSPFGEARHGPLLSVASDGDARRRAALYLVCMHRELPREDPLYPFLSELAGLNRYTGDGGLTMDFDYRNLFKRLCTLLCSVQDLRHLDTSEFTPSERNTHRALSLLGEMFDALVEPFINPTLSLSQQITHLVKFAHIACALFLQHGGAFVSNELYGDLQCMVKNAIFKIAHSKVLNPMLKVFLCLLGDDVLETLFGRSRMIGGHSPNMAVDELRQRFCSALRMDKIFRKYPYLERRARRLRLVRSRDLDHLFPAQWDGDLTAQSCDILACWIAAVALAKAILAKYGCDMDFLAHFAKDGVDLMRPKGGKYPGVSKEVDRSLEDSSATTIPPPNAPESSSSPSDNDTLDVANILAFDGRVALETERAARAEGATDGEPPSIWIKFDDDGRKLVHKKTVIRTMMDPTFDINDGKSQDRLLRVRCLSIGGDSWDRITSKAYSKSSANEHLLKIQGSSQLWCVSTHLKYPLVYLDAAPIAEISLPDTRYEITGQILSLVPFVGPSADISWAWVTQFVAFESAKAKQASSADAPARMRHLSIPVNGRLVLPLLSTDLKQATVEEILDMPPSTDATSEKTWFFANAQLDTMRAELFERVRDEEILLKIPVYGPVKEGRYPYEAIMKDGKLFTFHSVAAPAPKNNRRPCRVCQRNIAGPDRQKHMGKHILLALRGVKEEKLTAEITAAAKPSATKPCTNVPLRCPLCKDVQWKYNMPRHLEDKHRTWARTMPEKSRDILAAEISITDDEEGRLIPRTDGNSQSRTSQKRPAPQTPAGTPRLSRVIRTSRVHVVAAARQPASENEARASLSNVDDDVFTIEHKESRI
ncbi:hypothetical protein B0H17DRAFT_1129209 [Mycena rosella]|uniref:Uncharacterized protein n=1 Tax=Mycena rosella TaxID=1033263 RepID=A0AAD7GNQ4_MYCRO|nr:hypothetical protein B0H17DRAFT_1129209 [Mycena rosella]